MMTAKMMAILNEATSCNAISHNISFSLQSLSQSIIKNFCISKTSKESQIHLGERNTALIVTREMYEFAFTFYIQRLKTGNLFDLKSEILFLKKEISIIR